MLSKGNLFVKISTASNGISPRLWWNDKSKQQIPSLKVLSIFTSNNLIQPTGRNGFYQLHDLLVDFLQDKLVDEKVDIKFKHSHFTESYRNAYLNYSSL